MLQSICTRNLLRDSHIPKRKISIENRSSIKQTINNVVDNRKIFLEGAKQRLGYKEMSDWYKITHKELCEYGGHQFLLQHNSSPYKLLASVYPEYEWLPWKFVKLPKAFWEDMENQRLYLEWAKGQLGYKNMSDWYNLSVEVLSTVDGMPLIKKHNNSISTMLATNYPEYEWLPWKFGKTPNLYWDDAVHQKAYLDWLKNELNIKNMNDWYKVTAKTFITHNGSGLLAKYGNSPSKVIMSVYPEHNWLPWKFVSVPSGFWEDTKNQRIFLDWVKTELGFQNMEDFYDLSLEKLVELGGRYILNVYKGHPYSILATVYPEYKWLPWKFSRVPKSFWDDGTIRSFMDHAAKELGVTAKEDWYFVGIRELRKLGGEVQGKTLVELLKIAYPEYDWEVTKFRSMVLCQKDLRIALNTLFPKEDIIENYLLKNKFVLNFYLPLYKIAIEYKKSTEKEVGLESKCTEKGIKLIQIPIIWDKTIESLEKIIIENAPNLEPILINNKS